jgi:Matrixin
VTFALHYGASKQIDLPTATAVMDKAFAGWQNATCGDTGLPPSIRVDRRFGNASCTLHEYNQTDANANIVMFRDDKWPYEGSANVLGLTTVTYSRKTGAIFDVDMEINSTQRLSVDEVVPPNAYDLLSIVTHEAGHFLGMGHSAVPTATMVAQYTAGSESFRELDPDDVAGICAVFPPGTAAACDANPRQGFSPECGIFPSGEGGKCSIAHGGLGRSSAGGYRWLALTGLAAGIGVARRHRRRAQAEGR